ncbi:hypothetical protein AUC61_12720 [Pseudomonas sp. S25]|uniref:Glycosyl hydrolases family 32 N-terminal domain-containing protein n=1 Tax=Pseudomonas maioricensis TaxID=1766623 RepID=A0ABS9ZIZ6_9PSED|nr:hypothetical protein [Pseudomonas sp. S25]MCI8210402.1 hypothetical protein [Pseudomonas sp. S25]
MSREWQKLGLLYCPGTDARHTKLLTHAANPLPLHLEGDVYRIFYCGRDVENRSSVGAVDIDIVKRVVIKEHVAPFFEHGGEGSFFADGVSIGNCYTVQGRRYMAFMGWQTPSDGHWRGDIGRVEVFDNLTIATGSESLLMGMGEEDPISLAYPWVEAGEHGLDMWYPSVVSWEAGNGEMLAVIKHATSSDGEHWERHGASVPYKLGVAQAFSRPTILKGDDNLFHMWFSFRSGTGESYRIGHAASVDGVSWQLAFDTAMLNVSPHGWDSEMVEYPFVLRHGGATYMLYNGNGYGRSGFGLAVLADV